MGPSFSDILPGSTTGLSPQTPGTSCDQKFTVRHAISGNTAILRLRTDPALSDWISSAEYGFTKTTITRFSASVGPSWMWAPMLAWLRPGLRVSFPESLSPVSSRIRETSRCYVTISSTMRLAQRYLNVQSQFISGRSRLGIEPFYGKSSLEGTQLHSPQGFVDVTTRRIPEILDELGWRSVDLVKMDVEGMERDILADCGDWISRVGLIVLEVHGNTSAAELSSFLRPHGWTLERLGSHEEPT